MLHCNDTAMLVLHLHEVAAEYAPDSVPHNSHAAHVEVCHLEKTLSDHSMFTNLTNISIEGLSNLT